MTAITLTLKGIRPQEGLGGKQEAPGGGVEADWYGKVSQRPRDTTEADAAACDRPEVRCEPARTGSGSLCGRMPAGQTRCWQDRFRLCDLSAPPRVYHQPVSTWTIQLAGCGGSLNRCMQSSILLRKLIERSRKWVCEGSGVATSPGEQHRWERLAPVS